MTTINVCFASRTLEMTKAFAAKAARYGSDEYKMLQDARRDYPTYEVVIITRKTVKRDEPSYKGLTYEYMEKYITAHDNADGSIMADYKTLRGQSEDAEQVLAEAVSYTEVKGWFLKTYPAIAQFHEKRAALLNKKSA